MSFTTSSLSNPCPICGDTQHKCRHHHEDGKNLCMLFVDARKGEVIEGYKCTGQTKCGTWGKFVLDNSREWTQEHRREWQQRRDELQRQQQAIENRKAELALSLQERDSQYREMLATLTLVPEDRADLKRRGFTDLEIDLCGIKSVKQYQQLQKDFSHLLPGVSLDGRTLITESGYLCPVRNVDNLIVSCQVRLRAVTSGRYRWLSSRTKSNPEGQTPHVYGKGFAELPLSVHRPQSEPKGIALIEGTGVKPFKTSQRLNLLVIGAAGGQWASSPYTFERTLKKLSAELGGTKTITVFPDAGDIENFAVINRWRTVIHLLHGWGWTVKIGWWGQFTKQQEDLDELEDYSILTYLSPEEFWTIVEDHKKEETPAQDSATEAKTPSDWAWQQWLRSRRFTPDIVLDLKEFQFPNLPEKDIIVAIKSGLGTGKTKAIIELMRLYDYIRSMTVGYRNNLLLQTINRALSRGLTLYHLREDDGISLLADVYTKLLFCLDSIHKVDGYFTGVDLYVDEIVSVLLHATGGGTLGDNQAKALKIFSRALQVCNRVFLLDGNLADIHADFIAKLAPNKRLIKVENKRKIPSHVIKLIDGINAEDEIKKSDKSALIELMLNPDVRPWVFCDSKERTEILGKILLEKGKFGYVLNSETSELPWAKEFLDNADEFILKYKPDFMILSPTAESGVSVTIKGHFTDKFSFFVGVQGTNSQHQAMFRLRDETIPHYVFCPERSSVLDRSAPQTYSIREFQRISNDRILQSGILATQSADNSVRAAEIIAEAIARQDDKWWDFSCELGAFDNYEMGNLRKCLVYALEEAGHDVEIVQWDINEGISAIEKKVKEQIQQERAKEIHVAAKFDSVEEARLKAKSSPNKDTQRRIEKTFLLDKLPGIDETPLWSEDFVYQCYIKDRNFIPSIQRFWMVDNFEVSQKRHESSWFYHATGQDFFSARVRAMGHDTIWALKELNIKQFIGQRYHKDSTIVLEFIAKLRSRTDIQSALKKNLKPETATGKERLEIISSLLSLIGYKNLGVGKRFVGKVRLMHYTAQPIFMKVNTDDKPQFDFAAAHAAVTEAIAKKFTAWMASDKSKVSWEPEPVEEVTPTPSPTPSPASPLELAVEHLQQVSRWQDITLSQPEIEASWDLLTLQEQQRLMKLDEEYKQSLVDDAVVTSTVDDESAIMASSTIEQDETVQKVDAEIQLVTPLFTPTDDSMTWGKRLDRAMLMGSEIAKLIYPLVPQQLLDSVWQQLTVGVQSRYVDLFASG